ncbi:MAG TPA: carboxypeptidase-like regulatory domain-containing protein [Thermoanaerobaculia bacterium]|nr:carboxypeptidase-like regulatory domain-containing protein [Thermoanaerobaculia bacterium]
MLLLLTAKHGLAATFEIRIREPKSEGIGQAVVRAKRIDAAAAVIEQQSKVPSSGTIALSVGLWELTLDAPGLWAAPKLARDGDAIVFDTFPTGLITGELQIDGLKSTSLPDPKVRFIPTATGTGDGRAEGVVKCSAADTKLQCAIPAGNYDLRIGAIGYSSHYVWSTTIRAGIPNELGVIDLHRGASLTGLVKLHPEVDVPLAEVRVLLTPSGTGVAERRSAQPNQRGFFQLSGLTPGEYLVTSVATGYRSDSRPVRVIDNMAADLREPLIVSPPRSLQIEIDPPLDPDGKRWGVSVARRRGAASNPLAHADPVSESSADEAGHFTQTVEQDGVYLVDVLRSGTTWAAAEVEVDRDVVVMPVVVKSRMVHGQITHGGRPLGARLRFGGDFGPSQQVLISDEQGRFRGVLPTEKEEWEILVESDAPAVKRTFKSVRGKRSENGELEFRLDVPETRQTGVVVREDGSPSKWALVNVHSAGEAPLRQQFNAGEDGSFELSGLDPGGYRLQAEERGGESEIVDIEIKEADQSAIQLVVREFRRIAGRVVAGTRPINGAEVNGTPRGIAIISGSEARTDVSGEFSLRLPPSAQFYDLIVTADGFPATMRRMTVSKEPLLIDVAVPFGTLTVASPESAIVHLRHRGAEVGHLLLPCLTERQTDQSGSFDRLTFAKLEVGEYAVCLAQTCVSAYVSPHASTSVSLR